MQIWQNINIYDFGVWNILQILKNCRRVNKKDMSGDFFM
jgi:hypothetical protein